MHTARTRRVILWLVLLTIIASTFNVRTAFAHPVHTTYTEITYSRQSRRIDVTIRVFADDFEAASLLATKRLAGLGLSASALRCRYLSSRFIIRDGKGQRVVFRVQRAWRSDDLLWIRLTGRANAGLEGGIVQNALLFDLFSDQVNIVKLKKGKAVTTFLFVPAGTTRRIR